MTPTKLSYLAKILKLNFKGDDVTFQGIEFDSRKVKPGNLFVTVVGERVDGNDYLAQAKANGAVAALVSRATDVDIPHLQVETSIDALTTWATVHRQQFAIPLIALTGSCGKTSVKNALASVCRAAFGEGNYLATEGNYNTRLTVPIMLLKLNTQHKIAVIEMGMDNFGDLTVLSNAAKPTVATISNIAPSHTMFVKDLAGVSKAKSEIFAGLQQDGVAVLNKDEPFFSDWQQLVAPHKVLTFAKQQSADVMPKNIKSNFNGCQFDLQFPEASIHVAMQLPGEHIAMNAACVAACAYAAGIAPKMIKQGLESLLRTPRRFQQLVGKQGSVLIDDGYNASPKAVRASIDVLKTFPGKKIFVLGAMRELGEKEKQYHFEIGEYAKTNNIDYLFTVGDVAEEAAKAFGDGAEFFTDRERLAEKVLSMLDKDTCVVLKGSNSMNMLEFVRRFEKRDED